MAETYVKTTRMVDERAVLHLSAMFNMMRGLLADADNDGERASETYFESVSAVGHS